MPESTVSPVQGLRIWLLVLLKARLAISFHLSLSLSFLSVRVEALPIGCSLTWQGQIVSEKRPHFNYTACECQLREAGGRGRDIGTGLTGVLLCMR
jgi:hypothetical protein